MQRIMGITFRVVSYGLAMGVLAVALIGVPGGASAAEIAAQTQQILPVGANTCDQPLYSGFTPYIYNGALHSFEFTVSDASYVAIGGSIGNTSIPLHYITRRIDQAGAARIHVDVPTTPITGTLPIQITLLSSHGVGHPICASVIGMSLGSGPIQNTAPVQPVTTPAPTTTVTPKPDTSMTKEPSMSSTEGEMTAGNDTATSASSSGILSITKNSFAGVCSTGIGAYRLWLLLLVLYVVFVALALWYEWPSSWSWASTPARRVMWIVIPLILLLAFWYFAVLCRGPVWMPVVAIIVAAVGGVIAFRDHPQVNKLLLLERPRV